MTARRPVLATAHNPYVLPIYGNSSATLSAITDASSRRVRSWDMIGQRFMDTAFVLRCAPHQVLLALATPVGTGEAP